MAHITPEEPSARGAQDAGGTSFSALYYLARNRKSTALTYEKFVMSHVYVQFPLSIGLCVGLIALFMETDLLLGHDRSAEDYGIAIGLGALAWLASEALRRGLLVGGCSWLVDWALGPKRWALTFQNGLSATVHALLQELIRFFVLYLAYALWVPRDESTVPAFGLSVLLGLGWAASETVFELVTFYSQMTWYEGVLPHEDQGYEGVEQLLEEGRRRVTQESEAPDTADDDSDGTSSASLDSEDALLIDADFSRQALESQLGLPLYSIPSIIVLVWRFDAVLLSITLSTVMGLGYAAEDEIPVVFGAWQAFGMACAVHLPLALAWGVGLRHLGLPQLSYITLIVVTLILFLSMALWGILY